MSNKTEVKFLTSSPYEAELRKVRGRLAYEFGVDPFIVFTDVMLVDILAEEPKTVEELCKIKGFKAEGARAVKYGPRIVAVFNKMPSVDAATF